MDTHTHLEDLSNEIFFEIFDYLHALDIFTAFTSLNKRILSILQSIPLRVIILNQHYSQEIDFLSSHLTFHAHQVISLKCYDTIRDRSSIISLLFNRHHFINLQSCKFMSMNPSTKLENVIQQIESLNRLASFSNIQSNHVDINEKDKCDITRTILMHKSSFLRSAMLHYTYDCLNISNYASNLISLHLLMSGSPNTVSIYSFLPILRVCHRIRYLHAILKDEFPSQNNNVNVTIQEPFINENDLPISPQLTTFDLSIIAICDIRSIAYILRCMPNLIRFKFIYAMRTAAWPFIDDLVNGSAWQKMLEIYVPFLSQFDFHISILKKYPKLDLDMVVNSFQYFVIKYPKWQMITDRWSPYDNIPLEMVLLRTFAYHKRTRNQNVIIPVIHYESFETRSTKGTTNDHYLYYSDADRLKLDMTTITPRIMSSFPLFQHINTLIIVMPILSSSNPLNIVNSVQSNEKDDSHPCVTYLSHIVHLPNVKEISFESSIDACGWKDFQSIIQACANVINLRISPSYLVLPELIDSRFLISIFQQIKTLKLIPEYRCVPLNFVLKLVQRFPSLTDIEHPVYSLDECVFAIDILLRHLKNLSYLKIYYLEFSLLDHPFSRNYIIDKRREAFGFNIIDEHKVIVDRNGLSVEIRLS